jgi:hypothetical protein
MVAMAFGGRLQYASPVSAVEPHPRFVDMRHPDSDDIGELARCIAKVHGPVSEAQLNSVFQVLFGNAPGSAEWEPFRAAYLDELCARADPQPSTVIELGARPQDGTLTAVGVMTLAWIASPRLELLDLFCEII